MIALSRNGLILAAGILLLILQERGTGGADAGPALQAWVRYDGGARHAGISILRGGWEPPRMSGGDRSRGWDNQPTPPRFRDQGGGYGAHGGGDRGDRGDPRDRGGGFRPHGNFGDRDRDRDRGRDDRDPRGSSWGGGGGRPQNEAPFRHHSVCVKNLCETATEQDLIELMEAVNPTL